MADFGDYQQVHNYQHLATFLSAAADDLAHDPADWESVTLEDFLRAWAAWLEDSPGYYANRSEPFPQQPSWSDVAGMVLAAKVYE